MNVTACIPCYRRPETVEKLLDSIEKYTMVTHAVVILQPKEEYPYHPTPRKLEVCWDRCKQIAYPMARNRAARQAMSWFNPDILWVMDDDVVCTEHTKLEKLIPLIMKYDTGSVAISRQVGSWKTAEEEVETPCPYNGGGYLIRPEVFKEVGGFTMDGSDEKDFGLRLYLKGYRNYRTRRSFALHEQGKSSEGGIYGALRHKEEGMDIELSRDTQFNEGHNLLKTTPIPGKYGGKETPWLFSGANIKITDKAKSIHNENHAKLEEKKIL